jgi:hypothetical protein
MLLAWKKSTLVRPSVSVYLAGHGSRPAYNGNIRKNYAGVGYTFNEDIDAFVPPKPFNSWILNEETAQWEAPVAMPEDAGSGDPPKMYTWNEETVSWDAVIQPE